MHPICPLSVTGLRRVLFGALIFLFGLNVQAALADIQRFVGSYSGSAEMVESDGTISPRDLSVTIRETQKGFSVQWTTLTHKAKGETKESTYDIDFVPSERAGVFAAAMKKNVFGHAVQLDPMKGEPYVWARITGDTLTIYSLFVDADGGYELQQFDRTLSQDGLDLQFNRISDGKHQRTIEAYLKKLD
ncbi:hypothetical protein [Sedimentitalea nanhaiensis]|uniref:Uncharacterized protein n=1 Tax=Sedimentitalea nanhaiensis TaxID=999627 RepID=A0A1I7DZZ6_9RHOB|nr:hypothetical protein [Sedimentitalea nanhaiensis]SFU17237.1 hypothetical protein SAMN05216236_13919 [Sedimentitalea nanhaiensis]